MRKADSFPFRLKWCEKLLDEEPSVRLQVCDAVMKTALGKRVYGLSGSAEELFRHIRLDLKTE